MYLCVLVMLWLLSGGRSVIEWAFDVEKMYLFCAVGELFSFFLISLEWASDPSKAP